MANVYLEEQGRPIFVIWNPAESSSAQCLHRIAILPGGSFEVVCKHKSLDESVIRTQIRSIIHDRKKND